MTSRSDRVTVCFNCERISRGTRSTPKVCIACGEELVTMSRSEYEEGTYTIVVSLTVHAGTDSHLQTERAIHDEVRSWLEGLNATVHGVTVRRGEERCEEV